jgi:hypothetical protein
VAVAVLLVAVAAAASPLAEDVHGGQLRGGVPHVAGIVLRRDNAVERLQACGEIELGRLDGQRRGLRARAANRQAAVVVGVQREAFVGRAEEAGRDDEHRPGGHESADHAAAEHLPRDARQRDGEPRRGRRRRVRQERAGERDDLEPAVERDGRAGRGGLPQRHIRHRPARAHDAHAALAPPGERRDRLAHVAPARHLQDVRPHRVPILPRDDHRRLRLVLRPRWPPPRLPPRLQHRQLPIAVHVVVVVVALPRQHPFPPVPPPPAATTLLVIRIQQHSRAPPSSSHFLHPGHVHIPRVSLLIPSLLPPAHPTSPSLILPRSSSPTTQLILLNPPPIRHHPHRSSKSTGSPSHIDLIKPWRRRRRNLIHERTDLRSAVFVGWRARMRGKSRRGCWLPLRRQAGKRGARGRF